MAGSFYLFVKLMLQPAVRFILVSVLAFSFPVSFAEGGDANKTALLRIDDII